MRSLVVWLLVAATSLIPGLMLLAAAVPGPWPPEFWLMLRWFVTLGGVGLAVHGVRRRDIRMAVAFVLVALVYNPLLEAGQGSPIWQLIDLFAAAPFLIYPFVIPRPRLRRRRREAAEGETTEAEGAAALAAPEPQGRSASDEEVAASAREIYARYGPKALGLARNRQRQLAATGRVRMAEEWRKLVAALETVIAEGAGEEEDKDEDQEGAQPVDIDYEEVAPARRPGAQEKPEE